MGWRFAVALLMEWTGRYCWFFHRILTRSALLYTAMITTGAGIAVLRDAVGLVMDARTDLAHIAS